MTARQAWPVTILLLLAGCHRTKAFSSVIQMADRTKADQLTGGFYDVEANAWRWAGPEFSLALVPPPSARRGARLVLRLYFPETEIQELGPMTIRARVDGEELAPETFANGGSYDFVRDIPACALNTNVLPFSFSFDKSSGSLQADGRQLAAVVSMASLEAK
jgi:hypothetical protein